MKMWNFPLGAAFLLLSLLIPGELWADTYDFTGTLTHSFGGNNTVTGQFSIDFSTNAISAFDFTTPFGTIDSTHYTALAYYSGGYLGLDFQGPQGFVPVEEMVLWFVTPIPFTSASLYTLGGLPGAAGQVPLEMDGGSVLNCTATIPPGVCTITTGDSTFSSGTAIDPPTATPEPSSLAILAIGLLFLFLRARAFRRSVPTSNSSPALSS